MPILNTPDFIFHNAIDFYKMGKKRATELFANDPKKDPYLWYHISAPAVNLSFSLELMLKTILILEKGSIEKKHEFVDLFKDISELSKNKIIKHFESSKPNSSEYPAVKFSKNEDVETSNKDSWTTEEQLLKILSTHSAAFVSWRYSFELSNLENTTESLEFDFGGMIRVIEAVANYLSDEIRNKLTTNSHISPLS